MFSSALEKSRFYPNGFLYLCVLINMIFIFFNRLFVCLVSLLCAGMTSVEKSMLNLHSLTPFEDIFSVDFLFNFSFSHLPSSNVFFRMCAVIHVIVYFLLFSLNIIFAITVCTCSHREIARLFKTKLNVALMCFDFSRVYKVWVLLSRTRFLRKLSPHVRFQHREYSLSGNLHFI